MSLSNCRFYEEKYPEIDSFVMVNVKQIADMGAYVKLLEYDNIDGMILLSELSRRRIRSIQKLIRVGRNEVVVRRVSPEDIVKCEERYNKSKMVHSIMRHVAEKTQTPIEKLYESIAWPLNKKYGHSIDAFKLSITNPDVWSDITFPTEAIADELKSYIGKRLTPQPTKVRADIEVTCFEYDGIDAVKAALRTAEAGNTEENQVKVRLVSPPLYVLTNTCLDKNVGISRLEEAIVNIRNNITGSGGQLVVKMEPKAVTDSDDAELQALMEKRERENAEVSGDESPSAMALRSIWTRIRHERRRIGQYSLFLFAAAAWLPVWYEFLDHVGEITWIRGPSMYPFLNAEKDQTTRRDAVFTLKYNAQYGLRRGMIVTFWHPYNPEMIVVKRIVGLPGDVLRTRDPYPVATIRVPEGHVWVEGDAGPRDSRDSNDFGPISIGLIIGKVTHIVWPLHRAGKPFYRVPFFNYPPFAFERQHSLPSSTSRAYPSSPDRPTSTLVPNDGHRVPTIFLPDISTKSQSHGPKMTPDDGGLEGRPPYVHTMLAGGLGGTTGDMLMHSLDTVKTRQQGDPHFPPKYTSLGSSYYTIWRQEGIRRGLYGGWLPAMMGSFPGTVLFFGTYEWSKRHLLDYGVQSHVSYLTAGFLGDLAASVVYVPSEVLKTRLQLQGRHDNPFFKSGYNYKGTFDAARTIVRTEGLAELFSGYKATLYRDLPFSALQFMFYEQFQNWARQWKQSRDIGVPLELLTGAAGGGLAGVITCPLDVVKTRLQTQIDPAPVTFKPMDRPAPDVKSGLQETSPNQPKSPPPKLQKRPISTSSPSTHTPRPGAIPLDEGSIFKGLKLIYKTEGVGGWFRGVGPRFVWTSVQSGCMLFLYQTILRKLEIWLPMESPEMAM
ncbi:mitochondrial carrier [Xylariomycetidae sp. FL2044]|nr:mitochondrial carrier [Xylariomycetidae sp. FL2044]